MKLALLNIFIVVFSLSSNISLPTNGQLCILRLSAIGDVCHAVAMVTRIRHTRPDLKITWIIGKVEYQLLKGMDGVEFIVFDKKGGKSARQSLVSALNNRVFDALFVMQVALRANLVSRLIKAKKRIGFDRARSKEGHGLFVNSRIAPQQHAHVLEGFMGFADKVGIPTQATVTWDMPLSEDDETMGRALAQQYGRYAVIAPSASKAERNWLANRYAYAADYLSSLGIKVVLCGGPADAERRLRDDITAACQNEVTDLVGKTSLKSLLGVLKYAELVIAPDTGPAHMATTVQTPVIGLYAHSNPLRTGPYNSLNTVVSVYDQCIEEQFGKPWQRLPFGKRAKGDIMHYIEQDKVNAMIDSLIPNTSN